MGAGLGGPGPRATVLAAHGVDVVVVDERPRAGGQIYRQPPESFAAVGPSRATPPTGRKLLDQAAAAQLRWRRRTLAWGLFEARDAAHAGTGWVVALADADGVARLAAQHVLVASGAYDLPFAFPGWTLPGVMTAGGVQAFVKSERLLPGRRFVLRRRPSAPARRRRPTSARRGGGRCGRPRPAAPAPVGRALRRPPPVCVAVLGSARRPRGAAARPATRRRAGARLSHLIAAAEGDGAVEAATVVPGGRALAARRGRPAGASPATRSRWAMASCPRSSSHARRGAPSGSASGRAAGWSSTTSGSARAAPASRSPVRQRGSRARSRPPRRGGLLRSARFWRSGGSSMAPRSGRRGPCSGAHASPAAAERGRPGTLRTALRGPGRARLGRHDRLPLRRGKRGR